MADSASNRGSGRHGDDAAIGFDSAEREVFRSDSGLGQGIEQGGFADIGQTDNTAIETHTGVLCRVGGENESGFEAVQAPDDGRPVAGDHAGYLADGLIDTGIEEILLGLGRAAKHKACDLRTVAGMADAQAQAVE